MFRDLYNKILCIYVIVIIRSIFVIFIPQKRKKENKQEIKLKRLNKKYKEIIIIYVYMTYKANKKPNIMDQMT